MSLRTPGGYEPGCGRVYSALPDDQAAAGPGRFIGSESGKAQGRPEPEQVKAVGKRSLYSCTIHRARERRDSEAQVNDERPAPLL